MVRFAEINNLKYDLEILCDFQEVESLHKPFIALDCGCGLELEKSLFSAKREVSKRKQIKDFHVSITSFRKNREVSFDG